MLWKENRMFHCKWFAPASGFFGAVRWPKETKTEEVRPKWASSQLNGIEIYSSTNWQNVFEFSSFKNKIHKSATYIYIYIPKCVCLLSTSTINNVKFEQIE